MKDDNCHYHQKMSVLGAALVGAAAGALVATFAIKENREKIFKKMDDLIGKGKEGGDWAKERIKGLESQARQKAVEELEKARDAIKEEKK